MIRFGACAFVTQLANCVTNGWHQNTESRAGGLRVQNRMSMRQLTLFFLVSFCVAPTFGSEGEELKPTVVLRSLALLEQDLRKAGDDDTRKRISRSILDVGEPLAGTEMAPYFTDRPGDEPSTARASPPLHEVLKSGHRTPKLRAAHNGFWLLRAAAAVECDDEMAGAVAAQVLQWMGARDSEKDDVINVVAALNVKNWLEPSDTIKNRVASQVRAHLNRADRAVKEKDFLLAIAELSKAFAMDVEFGAAENNCLYAEVYTRGRLYLLLKKYDRAIQDYYYQVVMAAQCCGDDRSCDKHSILVEKELVWILATVPDEKYRDVTKAIEIAKEYEENVYYRDDLDAQEALAAAYAAEGRFDDAVRIESTVISDISHYQRLDESDKESLSRARGRLERYKSHQKAELVIPDGPESDLI